MIEPNTFVLGENWTPEFTGFAAGHDGGAWTKHQAQVLFETGHSAVYCVRIDLMEVFKAKSMKESDEFFDKE